MKNNYGKIAKYFISIWGSLLGAWVAVNLLSAFYGSTITTDTVMSAAVVLSVVFATSLITTFATIKHNRTTKENMAYDDQIVLMKWFFIIIFATDTLFAAVTTFLAGAFPKATETLILVSVLGVYFVGLAVKEKLLLKEISSY